MKVNLFGDRQFIIFIGTIRIIMIIMTFMIIIIRIFIITRKYPLRGYILGSGAPGTPGINP